MNIYFSNLKSLDLFLSISQYRIWNLLALQDVRQRYRRSVIGPFWITLSMLISISALGVVYTRIFKISIEDYLPYLTVGFVLWNFISTIVLESTGVVIGAEGIIKQVKLPIGIYVLRMVWRNLIILIHHSPVVLIVLVYFNVGISTIIFLFPLALLLTIAFGIFLGYVLGIICARYRDVVQIVNSVMQVIFYITPVIWKADLLKNNRWLLELNPFYYFLEIMRMSLLNQQFELMPWIGSIVITLILAVISMLIVHRTSSRIALWL